MYLDYILYDRYINPKTRDKVWDDLDYYSSDGAECSNDFQNITGSGNRPIEFYNSSVNGRERIVALCDVDFSGSASNSVKRFPKAKLYVRNPNLILHY